MKTKKTQVDMQWAAVAGFMCHVDREDGRRLAVSVWSGDGGKWGVMAIEGADGVDEAQGLLDNHAHKLVGSYPTPLKAIEAAESFARAWLKKWKA